MKWTAPKKVPQYINNRLIVDDIDVTDQFNISETHDTITFINKENPNVRCYLNKIKQRNFELGIPNTYNTEKEIKLRL